MTLQADDEKIAGAFTRTWNVVVWTWNDDPEAGGYDGPCPPLAAPQSGDGQFGFAFEAFRDNWQEEGAPGIQGAGLKALILDSKEYTAYVDALWRSEGPDDS